MRLFDWDLILILWVAGVSSAAAIVGPNDPLYSDNAPVEFAGLFEGNGLVSQLLTVSNVAIPPVIANLNVSNCTFVAGSDSQISFTSVNSLPSIPVGDSASLSFSCDTVVSGLFNASVNCTTDDPMQINVSIEISCTVVPFDAPVYESVPPPDTLLEFGLISVGETSAVQGIDIGNSNGVFDLTVIAVSNSPPGYNIDVPVLPLIVGASMFPDGVDDIRVECIPQLSGSNPQSLTVTTASAGSFNYQLACQGTVDAIFSSSVDNGDTLEFGLGSQSFSLVLSNESINLDITDLACGFSGQDAAMCFSNNPGMLIGQLSSVTINMQCNVLTGQSINATFDCSFTGDSTISMATWPVVAFGLPPAIAIPSMRGLGVFLIVLLVLVSAFRVIRRV